MAHRDAIYNERPKQECKQGFPLVFFRPDFEF